ncbi:hypothetical protein [Parasphingopyxis sp.]|uniref:hypothetical protein n=1 Tax=Parasphingopyxis sp. TaxID=1920299 RepID=UPI00261F55CE|nr:hypothetical protein [Parasphingopyxis sp.]
MADLERLEAFEPIVTPDGMPETQFQYLMQRIMEELENRLSLEGGTLTGGLTIDGDLTASGNNDFTGLTDLSRSGTVQMRVGYATGGVRNSRIDFYNGETTLVANMQQVSGSQVRITNESTGDYLNLGNAAGELEYHSGSATYDIGYSDGTTGGSGSAGAGNQYVELNIGGATYKVLHDGTV